GRLSSAVNDLQTALDLSRQREAGLEYESRILAHLANAYRLQGNLTAASRTAEESIAVGAQRGARTGECLGRIVLGHTYFEMKDRLRATTEAQRAEALVKETGALLYAPLLTQLKSRLASEPFRARSEMT